MIHKQFFLGKFNEIGHVKLWGQAAGSTRSIQEHLIEINDRRIQLLNRNVGLDIFVAFISY